MHFLARTAFIPEISLLGLLLTGHLERADRFLRITSHRADTSRRSTLTSTYFGAIRQGRSVLLLGSSYLVLRMRFAIRAIPLF